MSPNALSKDDAAPKARMPAETSAANYPCWCYDDRCGRVRLRLDDHLGHILRGQDESQGRIRHGQAIAQILHEWEADGNAMRYVGRSGQICWKATPKFLDQLRDRKLDAFEDSKAWGH